jgi:hypothetical protein
MSIPRITIGNFVVDPHTITGTWIIVVGVILTVVVAALLLRLIAPIKPTAIPTSDEIEGPTFGVLSSFATADEVRP